MEWNCSSNSLYPKNEFLLSVKTSYFYHCMVHTLIEKLFTDDSGVYKFSLSLNNIESYPIQDSLYWISSDILPEMMLEKFSPIISPKLIFEQDDSLPDIQYLEE